MTGLKKGMRILVSACLLGCQCNYKGQCSADCGTRLPLWQSAVDSFTLIPVCPEQLGGMTTPRIPSELQADARRILAGDGLLVSKTGLDVTGNFVRGAKEALVFAKLFHIDMAVLKSKSPSCGCKNVYDGTFTGKLMPGMGVTAQLLSDAGYRVMDEQDFTDLLSVHK